MFKKNVIYFRPSKRRVINLVVGIATLLMYEIARYYYRPFIYSNGINDFYIADTLGNSFGTIATVFIFLGVIGRGGKHDYFLINTVTISVFLYEIAHPLLGKPIDPADLVATVVAGGICLLLYRLLHGRKNIAVSEK